MDTTSNPSVMYARAFGIVLTLLGVLGFFVTTSQDSVESLLGFDVNLTHNIVHLVAGVLGIAAGFTTIMYARAYAVVLGAVFTIWGIWGLVVGDGFDPFGIFGNVNMADNFLHLIVGVLGLAAFAATREELGREYS